MTTIPPQTTIPAQTQVRGLSVEARWDGELLGGWTLDAGECLTAGPKARCDLVVSRSVLAQRRAVITLDASGETYAIDLPEGTLLAEPCRSQRDVYRAPAWRRVETTTTPTATPRTTPRTTHYPIDHPLDFRLGPWRLQIRPGDVAPKIARRRRGTKRPVAALIASALVHLLLIAAALGTPKPKIPLPDPSAFPQTGYQLQPPDHLPRWILRRTLPNSESSKSPCVHQDSFDRRVYEMWLRHADPGDQTEALDFGPLEGEYYVHERTLSVPQPSVDGSPHEDALSRPRRDVSLRRRITPTNRTPSRTQAIAGAVDALKGDGSR